MVTQLPQSKNWQKVKLGDLGKVITGKTPPTDQKDYFEGELPFITPTDIADFDVRYNYTTDRFVSEKWAGKAKNLRIPKNSTCFVCIGSTIGKMCLVKQDSFTNQQINSVVVNELKSDPLFIYYLLKQNQIDILKEFGGGGAAKPIINKSTFENIELQIPQDISKQRKITSILSAFDDKIEVNNEIVKTLEEMARAIFKEWFVNFRFPGYQKVEFVDSELGKIPKGWEIKRIKDIAKINKGISYSSEEIKDNSVGLPMINLANFQRGGGFNPGGIKFYTGRYKTTDLVKPGDILVAMTDLTSNREVIGHPARVPSYAHWEKILISLDVCAVDTEELYIEFLYYLMLRKEFSYLMASSAGGTNVAHLSKSVIENYSFVLPERNLIKVFQDFIKPVFSRINTVEMENQKLATLRDLLLPKLMKGEVRV